MNTNLNTKLVWSIVATICLAALSGCDLLFPPDEPIECPAGFYLGGVDSNECLPDTTSHQFTWDKSLIVPDIGMPIPGFAFIGDMAVISDNDIWIVGEFVIKDSLTDAWTYNNALHSNPWLLSINRSTVKFLRVHLRTGILSKSLQVEKLMRGGIENDLASRQLPQVKTIANMATAPDYPGQLAFLTATRPLIGVDDTDWLQLGAHVMHSATAAQIIDVGHAVNTANKTLGLMVRDTTNNRIMVAQGANANSDWILCDGTVTITPV